MPFVAAQLSFDPDDAPIRSEQLGIRLERQAVGDRAVVVLYPDGAGFEVTYARFIADMDLELPEGTASGTGQLIVTAHRVIGFVASGTLGSLLDGGPTSVVSAFSMDREDVGEFFNALNWRDRVKWIRFKPESRAAPGFVLKILTATLSLEDDGTTTPASLDKVQKAYTEITWTTESANAARPTSSEPARQTGGMDFRLIRVHEPGDDEGLLYPAVSDGALHIRLDEVDGEPTVINAKGMVLSRWANGAAKRLAEFPHLKVDLIITDARVAVVCVEWNKGERARTTGIHVVGAEAFDMIGNTARKIKEAHDRRGGRIVVGHVRYGWVTHVRFAPPESNKHLAILRVDIHRVEGDELFLSILLDRKVDSSVVARTIVQKVAAYRLKYASLDDRTRSLLTGAAADPAPVAPARPGRLASYSLPGYVAPSVDTCLPAG